jgi:hypothetical protein
MQDAYERPSAALILGSTEGAKESEKFKTNENACQTLRPILRVLQLGSNTLKQETLPGVAQKPLAICRCKALILQTSGSVKWGGSKTNVFCHALQINSFRPPTARYYGV